ncbi:MAG: KH domain-containing protein [Proteobacteria bacterium]|nr:KH domain-containing protein [Pseudomonadota bacterium]MBU4297404.1 KH domain-containing protein [Pseudomonadota bacterium]MCG2748748.1 KH domain-containing protein [Desulfobulbaceae bacterium]
MKELVNFIAASLVDQPQAVEVNETAQEDAVVIELRVAKDDLGKVIGKQGRTARAIRVLLSAAATRQNKRARLEIVE